MPPTRAVVEASKTPFVRRAEAVASWSVEDANAVKPEPKSAVDEAWKTPETVSVVGRRVPTESVPETFRLVVVAFVVVAFCAVKFWRVEEANAERPEVNSAVDDAWSVPVKRFTSEAASPKVAPAKVRKFPPTSAVDDAWRTPFVRRAVAVVSWSVVEANAMEPFVKSAVDDA